MGAEDPQKPVDTAASFTDYARMMEEARPVARDHLPFRHRLVDAGYDTEHIKSFVERPDDVIREFPLDGMLSDDKSATRADRIRNVAESGREFKKLRADYGIAVPEFQQLIAAGTSKTESVYTRLPRVEGLPLTNVLKLPSDKRETAPAHVSGLLQGIAHYYGDRFQTDDPYLADIDSLQQYAYGHVPGDTGNKLYLVDFDPYMYTPGTNPDDDYYHAMSYVRTLACSYGEVQAALGSAVHPARQSIHDLQGIVETHWNQTFDEVTAREIVEALADSNMELHRILRRYD